MNKQEQPQPKRVNVGRGIYVRLVISGTMLLLGGLIFEYSSTTSYGQGESAAYGALALWVTVVLPLLASGVVLFVRGLVRLGKQKPRIPGPILVLLGALIVGLPVIGGVLAQSPLFLGPSPLLTYRGHTRNFINSVAWSPDGKRIASAGDDDTVQVWDAATGNLVYTYRDHSGPVMSVAWSPDGKRIASGSLDQTVQVWDAVDGGHVFTYRGHTGTENDSEYNVTWVAWSPDGKRIASATYADIQVWDAVTGKKIFTLQGNNFVAWSPDGKHIASGSSYTTVQMWDAITGQSLLTYHGHSDAEFGVLGVAWSPDSKYIASASKYGDSVVVWDAISGRTISTYQQRDRRGVLALAWSPKDRRIASGYIDMALQVWDAISGRTISTHKRYYGAVTALAWSPNGKRIAAGYDDETVRIWDAS